MPRPMTARPPVIASSVAISSATCSGCSKGSSRIPVARRMVPAASARLARYGIGWR